MQSKIDLATNFGLVLDTNGNDSEISDVLDSGDKEIYDDDGSIAIAFSSDKNNIVSINALGLQAWQPNNADLPKYAFAVKAGCTLQSTLQV